MPTAIDQDSAASGAEETAGRGAGRFAFRAVGQWLAYLLPLVVLGILGWRHRYVVDDGFIYLRIVDNLLNGYGPVYNPGERVEVFTGVLWTFLLAAVGLLAPFALEWVAVGLGLGLTLAGVALGMWGSRRFFADGSARFMVPVGALALASLQPMWNFATTGLETGLTFAWLGGAWAILAHWATARERTRMPAWQLVVLGLGPLVRPELVVSSALFLLVVLWVSWSSLTWPGRLRIPAWGVALPVAYQVFRMGYFGELVASPAIAKEGTMPRPDLGVRYLMDFVGTYWLWIPILGLVVGIYLPAVLSLRGQRRAADRRVPILLVFVGAALLNAAFVVLMGGDYLHARLLLPAIFALALPAAVVPAQRRYAAGVIVMAWSAVALLLLRPPSTLFPFDDVNGDGTVTAAEFGYAPGTPATEWLTSDALYLRSVFANPVQQLDVDVAQGVELPTMAQGAIGLDGYYFGPNLRFFDLNGLATPLAAHMELTRRGHPGHEKSIPTPWLAAALTAPGTPAAAFDTFQSERQGGGIYGPLIPVTTGEELQQEIDLARAALECEPLADFIAAPRRPLTLGAVWSNFVGSFERTRLRIPPDPEEAYARFCT